MTTLDSPPVARRSGKDRVQSFGRFLSAMVMPNIGAFIAWGLITALFIKTGWLPNPALGGFPDAAGKAHTGLVGPMINYLLPLLIAYSGGKLVADHRGGVLGAIAAMGVIVGTDIPMFIGAMIMGPLGGWVIKQFDRAVGPRIPTGFEMLVNNFSAGIIGMLLAILGFFAIGPVVEAFSNVVAHGVQFLVDHRLLPLVSLFIEPGKILFLNNAINHGILTPLGTEQSKQVGKSVYFLLEANPGPGLGVLLAYWAFARGSIRASAPGAAIIHFLGGIHEIYFPYVLMRPMLILAVIAGGMTGVATLVALHGGLVSAASPGSIFAVMAMTPKGGYFANLAAIAAAALVSFLVSAVLLRGASYDDDALSAAQAESRANKGVPPVAATPATATAGGVAAAPAGVTTDLSFLSQGGPVKKVIFACDAGMGSSAMGATGFRKKVQAAGLPIEVTNTSIENIPADADVVVTQQTLTSRARTKLPGARHVSIDNFVGNPVYDRMIAELKAARATPAAQPAQPSPVQTTPVQAAPVTPPPPPPVVNPVINPVVNQASSSGVLRRENIALALPPVDRDAAVVRAGQLLQSAGYVDASYIPAMLEREKVASTYIGNGVAIPHGVGAAKAAIKTSGIVVTQYPDGVDFDGEKAYLVIGIAGAGDEHLQILAKIADALEDEDTVMRLARTTDVDEIYRTFMA